MQSLPGVLSLFQTFPLYYLYLSFALSLLAWVLELNYHSTIIIITCISTQYLLEFKFLSIQCM